MGYETNSAMHRDEHENQIIVKSDEVFAKKITNEMENVNEHYNHHSIHLILIAIIILIPFTFKVYKQLVKDVSRGVIEI